MSSRRSEPSHRTFAWCRTACPSHRHAKHRWTAESLSVVVLHPCTCTCIVTTVLYCIQYTVGQAASEETLITRWCECIHVANRWHDHSNTATFVRPWSRGVSHKFGHTKTYFTTSFARCHIEIICQHNHCIDTFHNTTSHRTLHMDHHADLLYAYAYVHS